MTKRRSNLCSRSNRSVKRPSTVNQQPNAHNHDHSDESSEQRSSVDRSSASPVLIPLHSRRLHRARTQQFHLITSTNNQNVFFLLGSTANEYTITVTSSSVSCNCKDSHKGCKHILFLCHALGLIRTGDNHILLHPPTFRSLLSAEFKPPLLIASSLDAHTNFLCSRHAYPPASFAAGDNHTLLPHSSYVPNVGTLDTNSAFNWLSHRDLSAPDVLVPSTVCSHLWSRDIETTRTFSTTSTISPMATPQPPINSSPELRVGHGVNLFSESLTTNHRAWHCPRHRRLPLTATTHLDCVICDSTIFNPSKVSFITRVTPDTARWGKTQTTKTHKQFSLITFFKFNH